MALQERFKKLGKQVIKPHSYPKGNHDVPFVASDSAVVDDEPNQSPLLLKILKFCLLVGMGVFAFANIKPYIDIVGYLGSFFLSLPFMPLLLRLPLIGWFLTTCGGLLQFVFGTALWAILQIFELLPSVMLNNPTFLIAVISAYRGFSKLAKESGDNRVIRKLKDRYNSLPTAWLETANHYKAVAYVADALLCLAFYPPIKGGWDNVGLFLIAPSMADIDWINALLALSSLFLVEVLYHGYRFISNALQFFDTAND